MMIIGVKQNYKIGGGISGFFMEVSVNGTSHEIPISSQTAEIIISLSETGSIAKSVEATEPEYQDEDPGEVFGGGVNQDDLDMLLSHDVQTSPVQEVKPIVGKPVDLGKYQGVADRSNVPSFGISRVDSKGNPILEKPPSLEDVQDDDGDQI
jgi:hypothetical protein